MAARKAKTLCCVRGRYRRTLGKAINTKGKLVAKKFLLGTDRDHAERANLRLEQLWRDIEKYWKDDPTARACKTEPIWEPLTLHFAEAIRKGARIELPPEQMEQVAAESRHAWAVANWYWGIRSTYPSVADLIEEPDHPSFATSRAAAADEASMLSQLSHHYAEMADEPAAAAPSGHTLHAALDAWAEQIREQKTRHDGTLIEGGRKIIEAAARLKGCHQDAPLDQLDFDRVRAMADHWCKRPPSKSKGRRFGNPISVATVHNMLGYLRRFLEWLHRSREYPWRDTDRIIEDALGHRRASALQTPEEVKRAAAGPEAWTIDELVKLYELATDRVRLYMLLGLNGGFAQSEIVNLLSEEIHVDHDPPDVRYIRHKTQKSAAFVLWPETVEALEWIAARHRKAVDPDVRWAILTETGRPLVRQPISNAWNGLLNRVQQRHPEFRRLSFKYLRKTNASLVSQCGGDSEVVAIVHGRAKRSPHDDQADVYYPRLVEKVRPALDQLRERLKPMFDAADAPFQKGRAYTQPGQRFPIETIRQVRKLREDGLGVVEIADKIGCSPSSVSRYTKARAS